MNVLLGVSSESSHDSFSAASVVDLLPAEYLMKVCIRVKMLSSLWITAQLLYSVCLYCNICIVMIMI